MDYGRRRTKKYTFKSPKIEGLRKLGRLVADPKAFRMKYGGLLSLLKINIVDGILSTMVQFYDPVYHCFTFSDYQLMPTLEEYSYLVGLSIPDQDPFFGLEKELRNEVISAATPSKVSEIKAHMTTKGGVQGLPAKFLMDQTQYFAVSRM